MNKKSVLVTMSAALAVCAIGHGYFGEWLGVVSSSLMALSSLAQGLFSPKQEGLAEARAYEAEQECDRLRQLLASLTAPSRGAQ